MFTTFKDTHHAIIYIVPRAGVEPARPNGHMALNHACLPVPAPGQYEYYNIHKTKKVS